MHKNVSQATICGHLFVLSIDCVCDNIWSAHRAISTDNFRIGRVTVFQWDTIAFMLHQSNYNSCRDRCAARRLQQSLQTSGIYVTVECILRRIYTMLFCTKLLVSTTDRTSIDFPYIHSYIRFNVSPSTEFVHPCHFLCSDCFRYYDLYWATQHLGFLVLGGFTMCTMCCFPANYCDVMHMASLHLGKWVRIESRSYAPPAIVWSKLVVWPPGAFVKHSGELYKACGIVTTAIPANGIHRRFYVSIISLLIQSHRN